ncbi:MAG: peptidylprolyl isomerase [Mariniblastus sp.]
MRSVFRLMAMCVISQSLFLCAFCNFQSSIAQDSVILATVNGEGVSQRQVDYDVRKFVGDRKLSKHQLDLAKRSILEKLINQKVALDFLKLHNVAAGESEIRLKTEELKNELAVVGKTIDDFLAKAGQTQEDLEFQFSLEISWQRYLKRKMTDEFLKSYFNQHRRDFDGTELRVAHLLLKVKPDAATEEWAKAIDKATQLKTRLDAFESWGEWVKLNSQAPSRETGGEIGWIKLAGPMPKVFTKAAFKLSKNQISDPVKTHFGVHLIKCIEVKQGKIGWKDNRDAVERAAESALFKAICEQHRAKTMVEYSAVK